MNSRLTEQAAAQHTAELLVAGHQQRAGRRPAGPVRTVTRPIRRRTGWALISVGLWLASEGR